MITAFKEKEKTNEHPPAEARRVCFVCTGNTCRSPMAEAVANALAREALNALPASVRDAVSPNLTAISAGLYANDGEPISQNAVRALEDADVAPVSGRNYHEHTAHTITESEVDECDLLVAMTPSHTMELLMRFPAAAQKITCMPEAVSDPFGGDLARYRQCLAEITAGVRKLLFAADAK